MAFISTFYGLFDEISDKLPLDDRLTCFWYFILILTFFKKRLPYQHHLPCFNISARFQTIEVRPARQIWSVKFHLIPACALGFINQRFDILAQYIVNLKADLTAYW